MKLTLAPRGLLSSCPLAQPATAFFRLRRLFSMFEAVKHSFFPSNIVFWEKTLFESSNTLFFGLEHCLSRKINEKTEKTMF